MLFYLPLYSYQNHLSVVILGCSLYRCEVCVDIKKSMTARLQLIEAMVLYFQREERAGRDAFRLCLSSLSPGTWPEPVSNTAERTFSRYFR